MEIKQMNNVTAKAMLSAIISLSTTTVPQCFDAAERVDSFGVRAYCAYTVIDLDTPLDNRYDLHSYYIPVSKLKEVLSTLYGEVNWNEHTDYSDSFLMDIAGVPTQVYYFRPLIIFLNDYLRLSFKDIAIILMLLV